METIKVIETKIIEHTVAITKRWPKDKAPEDYLSEAIESIGFELIDTCNSKILVHEIHTKGGQLL